MLTLAKIKEQKVFFVHFRKLLIESNVYAKFQIRTTCRQKVNLFFGGGGGGGGEGKLPPRRASFHPLHETNVHEKAHEE